MVCSNCKFYKEIGRTINGKWEQVKNKRGILMGWCRETSPNKNARTGHAEWPEVEEDDRCGKFEPIHTNEEIMRKRMHQWVFRYDCAHRENGRLRKNQKAIIKAVKAKYPRIRINDKAIEKAIEIIKNSK